MTDTTAREMIAEADQRADLAEGMITLLKGDLSRAHARIAELEARISDLIAGRILPADGADEVVVDGVRWVRVPAEATVRFERS